MPENIHEQLDTIATTLGEIRDLLAGQAAEAPAEPEEEEVPPPKPAKGKPGPKPKGKAQAITLEEVKAKLRVVVTDKGQPAVVKLLKSLGAKTANDLDEDNYAAAIAAADELLAPAEEEDPLA